MRTKLLVGIDISKKNFDVAIEKENSQGYLHKKYPNDEFGFSNLLAELPPQSHCVMEASGPYYLRLASYLHSKEVFVSVVNPLSVKHFSKMRMMRTKTDKKDAAIIAQFGQSEKPVLWQPKEPFLLELQQLQTLLENFIIQKNVLQNNVEAFTKSTVLNKVVSKSLTKQITALEKEIKKIELEMEKITTTHYEDLFLTQIQQ